MTERSLVVSGSLQRHQVREYVRKMGLPFDEERGRDESTFHVTAATDEQWDRIQAWVKKVTE